MRQLTIDDLEDLSLGSAVLGSGGGGDTSYALMMAKYLIEKYGPVEVVSIEELKPEDFIAPMSLMGAPLVSMERLLSGKELENLLTTIEKRIQKKPSVLMAAEIGGANAFTPLLIAAKLKIPLLDADMIGRAFPELQMSTCYLKGLKPTPAVLADCLGNTILLETTDAHALERIARSATVAMGSSSAVSFYLMDSSEVEGAVVSGSVSQALMYGKTIREARDKGEDPIEQLIKEANGKIIGRGTLIDIDQSIQKGFLQGSVTLLQGNRKITVYYQNEYLFAKSEDAPLASTPDLIVLLDEKTGTPITSEGLRYGLQTVLISIPAPKIWQTPEGLKLVGPKVFGYDIEYSPASQFSKIGKVT